MRSASVISEIIYESLRASSLTAAESEQTNAMFFHPHVLYNPRSVRSADLVVHMPVVRIINMTRAREHRFIQRLLINKKLDTSHDPRPNSTAARVKQRWNLFSLGQDTSTVIFDKWVIDFCFKLSSRNESGLLETLRPKRPQHQLQMLHVDFIKLSLAWKSFDFSIFLTRKVGINNKQSSSRPFNICLRSVKMCSIALCVMSMAFSKGLCRPSCLLWKNQYCSSVFCPGNLSSSTLSRG